MKKGAVEDIIELTELANKLFMYCDSQKWDLLVNEVFTSEIFFDMTSAGAGEPAQLPAQQVCDMWRLGFTGLDAIHHQAGHYLVNIIGEEADIYAYAIAYHYRKEAMNGKSRSFVGSYDLKATRSSKGWRISKFKYNLKFIEGNASLE